MRKMCSSGSDRKILSSRFGREGFAPRPIFTIPRRRFGSCLSKCVREIGSRGGVRFAWRRSSRTPYDRSRLAIETMAATRYNDAVLIQQFKTHHIPPVYNIEQML